MRQLWVEVPRSTGERAMAVAREHGATNLLHVPALGCDGEVDAVAGAFPNARIDEFVEQIEKLGVVRVTYAPQGVFTLRPPQDRVPDESATVEPRSPLEIYLSGLQSVGSWTSYLAYSAAAGVIGFIGLLRNTLYLLTAAMLIAPFASPAMNAAMASARGDAPLLARSLLRYAAGVLTTVAVAALLTIVLRIDAAPTLLGWVTDVSLYSVFLPLVGGAAGALNLSQSDRNSLLSSAATGVLVAAALAPPAVSVGMSAVLGRWDMTANGAFVLLMQVAAINLAGATVFRASGVQPRGGRFPHGSRRVFPIALAASAILVAALVALQLAAKTSLQRDTVEQRAVASIHRALSSSEVARLVEANVRFPRASIPDQRTMLAVVYVQRRSGVTASADSVRARVVAAIHDSLVASGITATPLVDVRVLDAP